MLFSHSKVLFCAIVKLPRCGADACLLTDVAFRLVYNIAFSAVDVGKWALTHGTFRLRLLSFIMTLFFQFLILFTDDAVRNGETFEEFCKSGIFH